MIKKAGDMTNYGTIKTTVRYASIGNRTERIVDSIEWKGPPIAMVSSDLLPDHVQVGNYFELGPYLFYAVEYDCVSDAFTVQRVDHLLGALYRLQFSFQQFWQVLAARFIYTLVIWDLARQPAAGEEIHLGLVKERWL